MWQIIEGDCRDVLPTLPERSIHTCVTSPPYFGLRDYGHDGQIGLEPTPDEFVAALVGVFREVRRVLRDDGTVWLNLGDSYAGVWRASSHPSADYKSKDLLGIPWMVAFALRADGWYLRSDIIWHKPNPMPESVTDRPTKAHEYLFLLSKSPRYFYDSDAVAEATTYLVGPDARPSGQYSNGSGRNDGGLHRSGGFVTDITRNKRSVWTVATQPYAGAHFATFPPKLIEPCILAGAPERSCGECGAPWVRVVERATANPGQRVGYNADCGARNDGARAGSWTDMQSRTLGFEASCSHDDASAAGVVLDPFAGSGTTGTVALRRGRSFIGIELSPTYTTLARERIRDDAPLLNTGAEVASANG